VFAKDPLYVLTAVSLFEKQWFHFEREISNVKLEMADDLKRVKQLDFDLADCEVKSTWLRIKKVRDEESLFLKELSADSITKLSEVFFRQLADRHMTVFTVIWRSASCRKKTSESFVIESALNSFRNRLSSSRTFLIRNQVDFTSQSAKSKSSCLTRLRSSAISSLTF